MIAMSLRQPLTYLFVPGNRPERFAKALASGADRVILDLEDAVARADKPHARNAIVAWVTSLAPNQLDRLLVRINEATSTAHQEDVLCLQCLPIKHIMLSKSESTEQLTQLLSQLEVGTRVLPLIETVRGVMAAQALAQAPMVERLAFGTLDYLLDLDLPGPGFALDAAALAVAMASRAADLPPPVAGVTAALDADQVQTELAHARALGFGAKMCIHPSQVAVVHEAFHPDDACLAWARQVLDAWQASPTPGAIQVDGQMVDKPIVLRAQRILSRARSAA